MLLHLGPNVITFRTLLHLGQLLHLGLQHTLHYNYLTLLLLTQEPFTLLTPFRSLSSFSVRVQCCV